MPTEKPALHRSYVCPPADSPADTILGWFKEAESEGLAFLQTQPGFSRFDEAIDIISGQLNDELPKANSTGGPLSRIRANLIRRAANEQIGVLTDLRDFWATDTNDKLKWDHHVRILNNLMSDLYHNTFVDLRIKAALQYAFTLGSGYLSPVWFKQHPDRPKGIGDIGLPAYGARDVYVIQPDSDGNLQSAYAVIIREELSITRAWRNWPEYQHKIVPDRDSPMNAVTGTEGVLSKAGRAVWDWINPARNPEHQETPFPVVDVFYIYVDDFSLNTSGFTRPMGAPGTSFYYDVPSLGSDVPAGRTGSGQALSRKAERDDCALYPNRRLIICTRNCVLYDGPSYWWHGQVPLVKFSLDEWAWNYLGFSCVLEVASLSNSFNNHLRNIDDSASVRLDPPALWDKNAIAESDMKRFSTRRPGIRMKYDNFKNENPLKFPVPPQQYDVPNWIIGAYVPFIKNLISEILGVPDLKALQMARQIPSGDSIEKITEMAGPIVRSMSRSMERSMRALGSQINWLFFQFYDMKRRIWVMGADGATEQDFDYDPASMVPGDQPGFVTTRMNRAKIHAQNFSFRVTPGSLHQIQQTSRKLLYLQLQRSGFMIDSQTVAEALDVPNFGVIPGNTVMERWGAEQDMKAALAGQLSEAAQQGAQPPGGGSGRPGRPPSGQQLPAVKMKSDGRTTISESG